MRCEKEDIPTSPRPSPPPGAERENGQRRLRLPSALPGRQARTARLRRARMRVSQASGASARRLRDMNKLGGGQGEVGAGGTHASGCTVVCEAHCYRAHDPQMLRA